MKLILSALLLNILSVSAQHWTYDDQEEWDYLFPACNGTRQSPINIQTKTALKNSSLTLDLFNYWILFTNNSAQNNGHTVRVSVIPKDVNQTPYISGTAVNNEKFIFDSLHFHWGDTDSNGSEHSLNNVKKSAEMHLVHYNQKYGNITNAMNRDDGLAVVAVFLNAVGFGLFPFEDYALTPIINTLPLITNFNTSTNFFGPLLLNSLLPIDRTRFYRYNGSLTTPPCSQTVTFLIYEKPIDISKNKLSQFRHIKGQPENGVSKPITHDVREQQPLNGRIVQVSDPFENSIFGPFDDLISSIFGGK